MLMKKLCDNGFTVAPSEGEADAVIVNTCGFIESAKTEAIEAILEAAEYKKAGLVSAVIVTGCLAERYKDEIMKEMPEVDAVVGIGANSDIVKICQKALCGVTTNIFPNKCYLPLDDERLMAKGSHWAYLKISDGCDNRCSYCAIPAIRGAYRERSMESIISEAEELAANGVKEIILVAQDTTKYGISLYGKYMLPELLKKLSDINGIEWIRIFYCYPDKVTDELIHAIASLDKVCSYIDIPLQHCSKDVLKAMNRTGSYDELKALIEKMRANIPGLSLRTTLMVGFPGETEEDFEETLDVVRKAKYDSAYTFIYSKRTGTPAAAMENQVPEDVVKNRFNRLLETVNEVSRSISNRYEGTVQQVLVEDVDDHDASYVTGRMTNNILVHFPGSKDLIGTLVNVRLTECRGFYYMGEQENA